MSQEYGRPIAVFWYNLAIHGAQFSVSVDGQLRAKLSGTPFQDNPYVRQEINKRIPLLVKLLDKRRIDPLLAQYIGVAISEEEADAAILLARKHEHKLNVFYVSGHHIVGNVKGME